MKRNATKALTEGAVLLATALVLNVLKDMIPLGQLPNGGSLLNVSMVPIVLYGVRWGMGWGFMAGFIFGGLNYFIGNGISIDWTTILFDYFFAFGMLGFGAGLFKGKKHAVYAGTLSGGGLQFLSSYLVGVFVWGKWMPDAFLGMTMTTPWIYSLIYNGLWAIPNIALALIVFAALQKPMRKYIRAEDLR